jgi:hypothetical protein
MFIVLRWRTSLLLSLKPENDCFGHEMYKIRYLPIFSIEILRLILFYFQWKQRYIVICQVKFRSMPCTHSILIVYPIYVVSLVEHSRLK